MVIIWGTKIIEKVLGFVADFCPLCRGVREHQFIEQRACGHVYYVSLGWGSLAGCLRRCTTCEALYTAERTRYRDIAPARGMDLKRLEELTFPDVAKAFADRLQLEATVHKAPESLAPEVKRSLMVEPFRMLDPMLRNLMASDYTGHRWWAPYRLLWPAVALFFLGGAVAIGGERIPALSNALSVTAGMLITAGGLLIAGALVLFLMMLPFKRRRIMRDIVTPRLRMALAPLAPTREEVEKLVGELRNTGLEVARALDLQQLLTGCGVNPPETLLPIQGPGTVWKRIACAMFVAMIAAGGLLADRPASARVARPRDNRAELTTLRNYTKTHPDDWRGFRALAVALAQAGDRIGADEAVRNAQELRRIHEPTDGTPR